METQSATPPTQAQKAPLPKKKVRIWSNPWLLVAALVTGVVIVYGLPAARNWWHTRQSLKLIAEARICIKNGDWENASRLLSRSYQADNRNPETLRLMARSLEQIQGGPERSLFFWRQLIEEKAATTADLTSYGTNLLRTGAREDAQKVLDSIPATERNTIPVLELKAAFLRADDQNQQADDMLRAAYAADSLNPESQIKLAMIDLNSAFVEVQERAVEKLWTIARSGGSESVNALRVLGSQIRLNTAQAVSLRELLEKMPAAGDELRLTVISGILRAMPGDRARIIASETARQQGRPFDQIGPFIRWLAANEEYERLLSLVPPGQAVRYGELFLPYSAAMERTRRWRELRDLIQRTPTIPIPSANTALILASCAHSLEEPSELVRGHLQEALKHANLLKNENTLIAVGNAADQFGHPDIAIEAFTTVSKRPQFRLTMLERMMQIRQRQHDIEAMIELINLCLKEQGANPSYIETWCYLKLLQGTEMEKAADKLRQHLEENPSRASTSALIQALAAYRIGDFDTANLLSKSINQGKLSAGQRAVLAGILQACGHQREAFQVAEKIPDNILLHEEKHFLQTAL